MEYWLGEHRHQVLLAELCRSKTYHCDERALGALGHVDGGKPGTLRSVLLRHNLCPSQTEIRIDSALDLLSDPSAADTELAITCILESCGREDWELLLRSRLVRLRHRRALHFLDTLQEDAESNDGTGPEPSLDDMEEALKTQDCDRVLLSLQGLLELCDAGHGESVKDVCRTHVGPLLASLDLQRDDPLLALAVFSLIIRLNSDNPAAVGALLSMLEEFSRHWPVEACRFVRAIDPGALPEGVRDSFNRFRTPDNGPLRLQSLYDLVPSYFVVSAPAKEPAAQERTIFFD